MSSLLSNITDRPLIAQTVTCYYQLSDIWAETPRYLYYCLLFLSFVTPRHTWLAHIFFGGAVTYAATAAFEAFILLSAYAPGPAIQGVSVPYFNLTNLPEVLEGIPALWRFVYPLVPVQPDYLELDIDAIAAVVVTAYLVGLPLQCWSSTARTSRMLHLLIFFWNILMLAGTLAALILWPNLNTSFPQFRFCFAGFDDGNTTVNSDYHNMYYSGSWNESIWSIFGNTEAATDRWIEMSTLCYYPCFSMHQILRNPDSLRATLWDPDNDPRAILHTWQYYSTDEFQPLIYTAVSVFTAAQIYLLIVGRLGLCTDRVPIYRPFQLWTRRREIMHSFIADIKYALHRMETAIRHPKTSAASQSNPAQQPSETARSVKHPVLCFFNDLNTIVVLLAVMFCGPVVIIAFVVWIERYLHADGQPREGVEAVAQWAFIVQIGVLLVAVIIIRFRHTIASEDEIQRDIVLARQKVADLEDIARKKRTSREAKAAKTTNSNSWSLAQNLGFRKRKPAIEASPKAGATVCHSTENGIPAVEGV
ncbi:hypothetical protein PV11_01944 [Exophiala sideris]|uniref:Uncharacterized protein n=1 Tax=Exophiala sideris TaxID=1016849 RepID=A0A0D1YUQ9_9EURO|nr:hypothetical protein PV11_01944 [Exophiala sideris]